jgi:hypothetical protein
MREGVEGRLGGASPTGRSAPARAAIVCTVRKSLGQGGGLVIGEARLAFDPGVGHLPMAGR